MATTSIPYRVWVADLNRYIAGVELLGHQTLVPKEVLGPTATQDLWISTLLLALVGGPKLIAEEWTGLTDKAGTPIFEGDIVDGTDSNGWETPLDHYRVIIEWSADRLMWLARDPWSGETFELGDYGPTDHVVGNVRENPELVKVEEEQT